MKATHQKGDFFMGYKEAMSGGYVSLASLANCKKSKVTSLSRITLYNNRKNGWYSRGFDSIRPLCLSKQGLV
jgi:hypothetical protein